MTAKPNSIGARRETLAGEVRSEVERMIVSGALESGQKLNEVELAAVMDVSRGTVREAIRSLAASGLIDLVANRGAFVHQTTLEEVRNLYDLRGSIFAMACASAARHMSEVRDDVLLARLHRNLDDMRAAHANDDRAAYYELNIDFHDLLLQASRNPKAKGIYDNLVKEMHLFRRRGLSIATNIADSISEHAAIVSAFEAGDHRAARQAALDHIEAGFGRYMKMLEEMPADTAPHQGGEPDGQSRRQDI